MKNNNRIVSSGDVTGEDRDIPVLRQRNLLPKQLDPLVLNFHHFAAAKTLDSGLKSGCGGVAGGGCYDLWIFMKSFFFVRKVDEFDPVLSEKNERDVDATSSDGLFYQPHV